MPEAAFLHECSQQFHRIEGLEGRGSFFVLENQGSQDMEILAFRPGEPGDFVQEAVDDCLRPPEPAGAPDGARGELAAQRQEFIS